MQPILPLQRGRKGGPPYGPPYWHPFTLQGKVQPIPEVSCTELLQQGDVQHLECLCQLLVVAEVPATFGGSLAGINQGCANVLGHKGLPLLHTGAHLGTLEAEPPVDGAQEAGSVRPVRQRGVCLTLLCPLTVLARSSSHPPPGRTPLTPSHTELQSALSPFCRGRGGEGTQGMGESALTGYQPQN